ncbi:MAG: glycosyltransferase family 4 protein [Acidimicrobiales bacterium]
MNGARSEKVLVIVEQLRRRVPGGAGTYVSGVLTGLGHMADAGIPVPQVSLLASRPRAAIDPRADPIASTGLPLIESHLPGPLMTRAWEAGLLRAPRGFGVVHASSLAVPRATGAATVVTVHDLAWRHVPFAFPRHGVEWHERGFRRALSSGCHFVVPSEPIAGEVRDAGAGESRVTVIEPGVDHLPQPDMAAAGELLERLGVRGGFIMSVGTLEPRKNLEMLVAAYSDIRDSLPDRWPLVIVGPQGWGAGPTSREGVEFAGHVSPGILSALYAKAELLAYVPLAEGFGLPPLEAMFCGTPVVASPVPSVGSAALVVNPDDRGAIAQALLTVSTDAAVREQLVKEGRARAENLTWERCASQHVELWRALVRRSRRG